MINLIKKLLVKYPYIKRKELANKLNISVELLKYYLTKNNIKIRKLRRIKLKQLILNLINNEHPQKNYSDYQLHRLLKLTCRKTISNLRNEMKIPKGKGSINYDLTRQYLYFSQGRYIWKIDGNHIKPKARRK